VVGTEPRGDARGTRQVDRQRRGIYTELPLDQALQRIRDYERKYEQVYGRLTAVNVNVLGVSVLPMPLTEQDRENGRLRFVEIMSNYLDEELAENGDWRTQERNRAPVTA
jgi:hypothetical protein